MKALRNQMVSVCDLLLKTPSKCKLDYINNAHRTALMSSCRHNTKEVVLKILENTNDTTINYTNNEYKNAFTEACVHQTEKVCLAIFEKMNIENISVTRNLFVSVCNKQMENLSNKLYPHLQTSDVEKLLKTYSSDLILQNISRDNNSYTELQNRINMLKEYDMEMIKTSTVNECLICMETDETSYYRLNCSHVMSMCGRCKIQIKNKCPVCRTEISTSEKVYIVG